MTLLFVVLSVILLLIIVFLTLLLIKLKITVTIKNKRVQVYVFKIKVFDSLKKTRKSNDKNKEDEFVNNYKTFKEVVNLIRRVFDDKNDDIIYIIKHIKNTFSLRRIDFALDYGFGDAAVTGVSGGVIWVLISGIASLVGKYIDIKKYVNIAVKPHYTEKIFEYNGMVALDVRTYHLLSALRLIIRFRKTLKGGNINGTV